MFETTLTGIVLIFNGKQYDVINISKRIFLKDES